MNFYCIEEITFPKINYLPSCDALYLRTVRQFRPDNQLLSFIKVELLPIPSYFRIGFCVRIPPHSLHALFFTKPYFFSIVYPIFVFFVLYLKQHETSKFCFSEFVKSILSSVPNKLCTIETRGNTVPIFCAYLN